jgi:hypothetical protein
LTGSLKVAKDIDNKQTLSWTMLHDTARLTASALGKTNVPAFKLLAATAPWIDEGSSWVLTKYYNAVYEPPSPLTSLLTMQTRRSLEILSSYDPNSKLTVGVGPQGFVPAGSPVVYTVQFENVSTASLPAQKVVVTDPLNSNLDWSTLQLGQIGFNNTVVNVPSGLQSYSTQATVSTDPNPVAVNASFDPGSGTITWTMQSINSATGGPPTDPLAGFLPPDNSSHQGEGYVTFSVVPKAGLANGAVITNQATIVFDVNSPISTNTVTNTIDTSSPTSSMNGRVHANTISFTVSWKGTDPTGSGVAYYNIYFSTDHGPYQPWLMGTSQTSAVFTGTPGHHYSFYSVAVNSVGDIQNTLGPPQTVTTPGHAGH